jgi:H+/Cl- antiporter ClcA
VASDCAPDHLLIAALAVVAALFGLAFKAALYRTEDVCGRLWRGRPEWARPAGGGAVLGPLLLAIPQLYGVGYPVMDKAIARQLRAVVPDPARRRQDPTSRTICSAPPPLTPDQSLAARKEEINHP